MSEKVTSNNKTTLNEKIKNLDEQIEWFYSDDFELEQAVEKYKNALDLAREISKDLDELKNEIEVLTEDFSK